MFLSTKVPRDVENDRGSTDAEQTQKNEFRRRKRCRLPTYPIPIKMSRVLWLGIEVVVQV